MTVDSATRVAPLLASAFRCLDQACLPWALLRGADDLLAPRDDVDVLVAAPAQAALEALRAAGFREVPGRGRAPHRFSHAVDARTGAWLQLDVVDRIAFGPWQQLPTGWASELLARRRQQEGVARLDARDESWLYVLHQVLDKRRPAAAASAARALTEADPVALLLDGRCGAGTSALLLGALRSGRHAALPLELQRRWSGRAVTHARSFRARALRVLHDGGRWRRGDGRTVAVLGPDGAGKSTVVAALREASFPVEVNCVYFGLWREYAADRRLRHLPGARFALRVLRALRQTGRARYHRWRGGLVLLDRSPYDALLGEAAGSLGGRLLGGLALAISPRPDAVLLLDAPGDVMFARKGEDSVEVLEWRRQRYLGLTAVLPELVVLDATAPSAEVGLAAASAIWRRMAAPGRKRTQLPLPAMTPAAAPSDDVAAGDPLRAWRRLDWQFLLTRPLPDLIALGGRHDGELVGALHDVAGRRTTTCGTADLLVLLDPARGQLATQLPRALPGGEVYIELSRAGPLGLAGWPRAARAAGLEGVRLHWHVHSGGRRTRFVPLRDKPALLDTLARYDAIRFGWLHWLVARAMLAAGLLPLSLRHGSLTGFAPGAPAPAGTGERAVSDTFVWELLGRATSERPAPAGGTVFVTPSDATSRHVVALGFDRRANGPMLVAKVPRRIGDDGGVRCEATLLPRLALSAPELAAAVPHVVAMGRLHAFDVLVTTGLDGRPLTPARVRRDVSAAVRAGVAFVEALPVTSRTDPDWYARYLDGPVTELVRRSDGRLAADVRLRTSERLERLRSARLPTVFEHGDLSDPNLLVRAGGSLQVLDWERANELGLPGHDLVQFLTYVADARRGARSTAERLASFDAAFVGASAWAKPILDEHLRARGVDPDLRAALVLACWARTSASLVPRVLAAHAPGPTAPASLGAVVADEPDVARWLYCLQRFDDL